MNGVIGVLLCATLGIDVGWQPLDNGRLEYIVQLEPQLLSTLLDGYPAISRVPSELNDIGSIRIVIGSESLPRRTPARPTHVDPVVQADVRSQEPHSEGTGGSVEVVTGVSSTDDESNPASLPPGNLLPDANAQTMPAEKPESFSADEHLLSGADGSAVQVGYEEEGTWATGATASRPWKTFFITLFALFLSIGANIYLWWVASDTRKRYRGLLRESIVRGVGS